MATEGTGRAQAASQLTALPKIEDIPRAGDGLDEASVREAFDAFRRHAAQLQAQLRVLQAAAGRAGAAGAEATGHAVRMDALHLSAPPPSSPTRSSATPRPRPPPSSRRPSTRSAAGSRT